MTEIQSKVVQARLGMGYSLLGSTSSFSVAGSSILISKGRHTMLINCLGFDEHISGITYKLKGNHE